MVENRAPERMSEEEGAEVAMMLVDWGKGAEEDGRSALILKL